jgi:hypothetical protein
MTAVPCPCVSTFVCICKQVPNLHRICASTGCIDRASEDKTTRQYIRWIKLSDGKAKENTQRDSWEGFGRGKVSFIQNTGLQEFRLERLTCNVFLPG